MTFSVMFFSVTNHQMSRCHSGQFSLHLSHQGNRGSRDRRSRWCHLPIIPGTTPHCLVSTEGNVNCLGTRNLVYVYVSVIYVYIIFSYLYVLLHLCEAIYLSILYDFALICSQ